MHRHSASMIAGDHISSPQVLICHEPTTDLDVTTWAEPMPFIPHDLNVAASLWTGGPCSAGARSGKWCSRTRNWIRASRPASPFRTPATCMQSSRPQIHGGGPGTARPGGLDGTARRRQTPTLSGGPAVLAQVLDAVSTSAAHAARRCCPSATYDGVQGDCQRSPKRSGAGSRSRTRECGNQRWEPAPENLVCVGAADCARAGASGTSSWDSARYRSLAQTWVRWLEHSPCRHLRPCSPRRS